MQQFLRGLMVGKKEFSAISIIRIRYGIMKLLFTSGGGSMVKLTAYTRSGG
jgi:hypothetical protein